MLIDPPADRGPLKVHILIQSAHEVPIAFFFNHHHNFAGKDVLDDQITPSLLVDLVHVVDVRELGRNGHVRSVGGCLEELAEDQLDLLDFVNNKLLVLNWFVVLDLKLL